MGEVITVASDKGGVGKTTITANPGIALAMLNQRVVLVDAELSFRNLDVPLLMENQIVDDLYDVVVGKCSLRKAFIMYKNFSNLFLISGSFNGNHSGISFEKFSYLCNLLKNEFDYVKIACPSGIDYGFKNSVAAANRLLVVVTSKIMLLRDADSVIRILDRDGLCNAKLIINRIRIDLVKKGMQPCVNDIIRVLRNNF